MDEETGALFWKIEKLIGKGDYIYAKVPNHPRATSQGYVLEHRIIMENHLCRLLDTTEVVHHQNGNRKDNRLENLEVMDYKEHVKYHGLLQGKKMADMLCPTCKSLFTREYRQTHLCKTKNKWTACSSSCRGKFSRKVQLHGTTEEVEKAISGNLVRIYKIHDNREETACRSQDP